MKNIKYFLPALLLLLGATVIYAEVTFSEPTPSGEYQTYNFFKGGGSAQTATTTTATSTNLTGGGGYFKIAGANNVSFQFSRGDTSGQGNSGSTVFKVQVTPDGSTWLDYNTLLLNSATSSPTSFAFVTVPAGTSTITAYMENLGFYGVRCIAVEATDGEHTCKASADF